MNKLNDIAGKNPFKVPENYFEEVNKRILSETIDRKLSETIDRKKADRTISHHKFRYYLAAAAAIAGFVLIGYITVRLINNNRNYPSITENLIESNTDLIINDIDLLTLEKNAELSGISEFNPEVSNDGIIEYLLLENIELNDIYEQL